MNNLALNQILSWQEILAGVVTDPDELIRILELDAALLPAGHPLLQTFPVRVPAPYLARMEKGNPRDPLLLQVFPAAAEALEVAGYCRDPLAESSVTPAPGVLHKYRGRALLLTTGSCAVHCRYCFRRHFPYGDHNPGRRQWKESLKYLASDAEISEVILSGGDPFTLTDHYLAWFYEELAKIKHIRRIRIHTRLPVMIPQRITSGLCKILANSRFQTILVVHSNHAREFDREVDEACQRLQQAGGMLLNQSVLLRGINDSGAVLAELSERLLKAGILPYYLHLLDPVAGAAHFDVAASTGRALIRELQAMLPGYLVPRLVMEVPGEASKTLAGPGPAG